MFPTADTEDIIQVTPNSNSSPSSDVRASPQHTQVEKQNNSKELTVNMLIKELVFCVALALTTYGALHNTPAKISKHPQAVRFFGPNSLVTDWYMGQLHHAMTYINNAEISFVMYYAPWDAECQYVKDEFDKAANVLIERVHFSAINCWNPDSECRMQHNKIPSWPILMVYTINSRGVLYKGPRDAHSMVTFLELIMRPLYRVSSAEDLVNLLSVCDAVAIGFTPLRDTSKYYNLWYQVALKSREFDIVGEICFAVVTSEGLCYELGVENTPMARLLLWNDTKEYIVDEEQQPWNESTLITWVLDNFTQPVARIIPLWRKMSSFEKYVDGNPILMLFTPLNPLYPQLPSFNLLREIAMEYYNCKNNDTSQYIAELVKLQQVQRLLYQQKNFDKICQEYKFKKPILKTSKYYKKEVVSHNNKYPWSNTTQKNQKNGLFNFLVKRGIAISKVIENSEDNSELLASLGLLQECSTVLPADKSFYENQEQCKTYEDNFEFGFEPDVKKHWGNTETSMLPLEDDPLASINLAQQYVKHFCSLMRFAKEFGPVVLPEPVDLSNITSISGLACEKNFSLNMLAVDSVQNHHFAESLGIDITNKKDMTAVVILDSKHESQYVLSEPYSARSVRDFIYNFTHKSLKRSLRTHVEDAAHTHYYGSESKSTQTENNKTVHILDLTTKSFRRVVKTPGKVSLVAVCGGACGAHVSRALREAARLLAACGAPLRAARLDALRHDLPWHLTSDTYPAIFVFTAHSAGGEPDSRLYPRDARVSAGGLAALVLRALGLPLHLRVRLALCATAKANLEKQTCLKDLKEHLTTVIGRNLKYWRRTEDKRLKDAFLKRLQYLHQVSLDLSLLHISDLSETRKKHNLLNSLNTLAKNWDIDTSILKSIAVSDSERS